MIGSKSYPGPVVFGLDIGTRSIVGTVGYKERDKFYIIAQRSKEHDTRAMIDGQIHDIGAVGNTILEVKKELENLAGRALSDVCIAAAGRVLRTINTRVEYDLSEEREVTSEDVYTLDSMGIEQAYAEFTQQNDTDLKFFCVGYSVVRYYMNGYPISNLESHKARIISADLIATFLPDDVVDGLQKSVELAGLEVANLTLEPIAAIQVAIPEMYRMLNIALVDVGAGTSDISITKDGSIVAYGMIPIAGDSLTETISTHCLVDFITADMMKRKIHESQIIEYADIMGIKQNITSEELLKVMEPALNSVLVKVSDKIKELNGGKSVSAVFVVGGGGKIPTYTERLADLLGIQKERVALRGEEVMQKIEFLESDIRKDSLLVTPIGICLSYYEQSNNFIFVNFNGRRLKLFDNNKLAIVDAAMQAGFPHDGLFPKRGKELNFTVNGRSRIVRGELGEAAVINLNGEPADIHSAIKANDYITVEEATAGAAAKFEIGQLADYRADIKIFVNQQMITLPKFASVNGQLQSEYYDIQEADEIEMLSYYTVKQVLEFMDVILKPDTQVYVNNMSAHMETQVYENFSVLWTFDDIDRPVQVQSDPEEAAEPVTGEKEESDKGVEQKEDKKPHDITIQLNGRPFGLSGKGVYRFVDIFDFYEIDLSKPQGKGLVTEHNNKQAKYMDEIEDGDEVSVYWKY